MGQRTFEIGVIGVAIFGHGCLAHDLAIGEGHAGIGATNISDDHKRFHGLCPLVVARDGAA
jgi:hypothetical protein